MRSALLVFLISVCASSADAQSDSSHANEILTASNSVYAELGGPALYYSANYDRLILTQLGIRVGFGLVEANDRHWALMLPVFLEWLPEARPWTNSNLEFDAGFVYHSDAVSIWYENIENSGTYFAVGVGYRYQSIDDGILFRITATPLFFKHEVFLFGGVSLGYAF
jgi:hypothetical protein